MIKREEVIQIGEFNKPHGICGELSFTFSNDCFDDNECPFLICEMDGILVPFVLESYRFRSDTTALVQLQGIDTAEKAKRFTNATVYFPKQAIPTSQNLEKEDYTWDYFLSYTLYDELTGKVGTIINIDDSTINVLFIVNKEGTEVLVPAAVELITKIDHEAKTITFRLPDGILAIG